MKKLLPLFFLLVFLQSAVFSQLGQHLNYNLNVNGTLRQYRLYIPPGHDGSEPWPLVMVFHGAGVSLDWQVGISQMHFVADTAKFLIAYPKGLVILDTFFNGTNVGWLVPGYLPTGTPYSDVAFVKSLIDHVDDKPQYAIDRSRVYATGWSNGSEMSFWLACALGDEIAAVAGVASQLSNVAMAACAPSRQMSILYVQGSEDVFVPLGGDDNFPPTINLPEFWSGFNNCNPTPDSVSLPNTVTSDGSTVKLFDYADCDADHEVLYYRVDGGGHNWPGGWLPDGFPHLHPINKDIHASVEIWNFFNRHKHPDIASDVRMINLENKAAIYPNPAVDEITFHYKGIPIQNASVLLRIFNHLGNEIKRMELSPGDLTQPIRVDLSGFSNGAYWLKLEADGQPFKAQQFSILGR